MPEEKTPYQRMLEKLARMLGRQTTDQLLKDVLDDAIDTVKNYCNIKEIPPELESTVVKIARDGWRAEGYGQEDTPQRITSVSRGDVSTSYESEGYSDANSGGGAGFAQAYQKILNSFRVPRWRP